MDDKQIIENRIILYTQQLLQALLQEQHVIMNYCLDTY